MPVKVARKVIEQVRITARAEEKLQVLEYLEQHGYRLDSIYSPPMRGSTGICPASDKKRIVVKGERIRKE